MALYNLNRAHTAMASLEDKTLWEPHDTASFDCMHYLGDAALDHAASKLGLKPGDRVVDIGSGFSATGRYLHQKYGVDVTGVELQGGIHQIAETITRKNEMGTRVRSVNGDFTKVALEGPVDCIVSFLCILHIPDRGPLFEKAARLLKPGGKLYIEDFFASGPLSDESAAQLRDVMSCPRLPTREEYLDDLTRAGFVDIETEDMSTAWSEFVHERAVAYRAKADPEPSLVGFYDTVDSLFRGGSIGGARISCARRRPW